MTVIVPNGRPLDGKPANPRQSRQRDRTGTFWPVGRDGDTLYLHLNPDQADEPVTA